MKLLLVDGHYYLYRSFFAIRNLKTPQGQPTNALYGLIKALKRMIQELNPDRLIVVLDGGLPQERIEQQPEYKANRAETPDELLSQFPWVQPVVEALGYKFICVQGEEADDVIATFAKSAAEDGAEVFIATSDKDIMQMVSPTIRIYQPQGETFQLLGPEEVQIKWGVDANQIGDLLALTGDKADNIPGIPGVGPKTAADWINQFGSLDNLLDRYQELKNPRHREIIENGRNIIASNRIMVKLKENLQLPFSWSESTIAPDYSRQVKLFQELNFKTFLAEAEKQLLQKPVQGDLFS